MIIFSSVINQPYIIYLQIKIDTRSDICNRYDIDDNNTIIE